MSEKVVIDSEYLTELTGMKSDLALLKRELDLLGDLGKELASVKEIVIQLQVINKQREDTTFPLMEKKLDSIYNKLDNLQSALQLFTAKSTELVKAVDDHEVRLRKLEESKVKYGVQIGVIITILSMAGNAVLNHFIK